MNSSVMTAGGVWVDQCHGGDDQLCADWHEPRGTQTAAHGHHSRQHCSAVCSCRGEDLATVLVVFMPSWYGIIIGKHTIMGKHTLWCQLNLMSCLIHICIINSNSNSKVVQKPLAHTQITKYIQIQHNVK